LSVQNRWPLPRHAPRPRGLAVGLGALLAAACGTGPSADPTSRFFAVHNVMRSMGLTQLGAVHQGALAQGQEVRLPVSLPAGCLTMVALGGAGTRDLDVRLLAPDGTVVAEDGSYDVEAVVRACVERPGDYVALLRMARGAGEYVVSSWTGGGALASSEGASAISSTGGTCDGPTAAGAGQTYTGSTEDAAEEHEGTCGNTSGRERIYRLDVPRRQRITLDVAAQFDSVLYLRKGDCSDDSSEVTCNDDMGGNAKRSRIDTVVDPGTYFVFVDGADEGGNYRLKIAAENAPSLSQICHDAHPLAAAARAVGHFEGSFDNVHATCGRDAKGADLAYRFDLPTRARVRLLEKSADFHPALHVRRACEDEATEIACSDSGLSDDEAAWAGVLDPGVYWVFADSADEVSSGSFTISAETAPDMGIGPGGGAQGDTCGDAVPITSTAGRLEGDTFAAKDDVGISCGKPGAADVVYRLDLAHRSRISARILSDEAAHAMALMRSCGDRSTEVTCGNAVDRVVDAGTYFLVVDAARPDAMGRFSISYKVRDVSLLESACGHVPSVVLRRSVTGTTVGAGDKFSPSCGVKSAEKSAPDRVYKFVIPQGPAGRRGSSGVPVRLSLKTQGFHGLLSVRRACADDASEIKCAEGGDDPTQSQLSMVLEPGTYYAVVDGSGPGSQGAFTLALDRAGKESGKE
jgi:hypothetical protein